MAELKRGVRGVIANVSSAQKWGIVSDKAKSKYPTPYDAINQEIEILTMGGMGTVMFKFVEDDGMRAVLHIKYISLSDTPQVRESKCQCNIMMGCSCGVFEKEMKAQGKVYDSVFCVWRDQ